MADKEKTNPAPPALDAPGGAWRLALPPGAGGSAPRRLVYGAYDGYVRLLNTERNQIEWETCVGGFPFAVAWGRSLDAPIGVASADGRFYALRTDGSVAWSYDTGFPLYNACFGFFRSTREPAWAIGGVDRTVRLLDGTGSVLLTYQVERLVHRLAAADFDGDGLDELVAMDYRERALLLKWDGVSLGTLWSRELMVPKTMLNWENPNGFFHVHGLAAGDIDGDGEPEVVAGDDFHNRQPVMACDSSGEPLWLSAPLERGPPRPDRHYDFYAGVWLALNPDGDGGTIPSIFAVSGATVRGFSGDGRELGRAVAKVGFCDVAVGDGRLWLGSSPDGDESVYAIPLDDDWAASAEAIERRGPLARIGETLAQLGGALERRGDGPREPQAGEPYALQLASSGGGGASKERMPGDLGLDEGALRFHASDKAMEPGPLLHSDGGSWNARRYRIDSIRGTQSPDEIVRRVERLEQAGTPTIFRIGHSCMPFVSLETAERMLRAGPRCVAGFESAEDEDPDLVPRYFSEYMEPLADLCLRYGGKKLIVKNKGLWWMSMPSRGDVFASLFGGGRGKVVVAATEDSNSRCPEVNLMARVGIRQAGLLDAFQVSVHADLFSYSRFHQWEYPKSGHPYLRLLAAQTALGGSRFRLNGPLAYAEGGQWKWTLYGTESAGPFVRLIQSGLLAPPEPRDNVGLCRVGFAVHPPPAPWLVDAHNGHRPHAWPGDKGVLAGAVVPHNGVTWGNGPTPSHAIQSVLFGKRRQFGYFVPPTPYGLPIMAPALADRSRIPGVDSWWHTDGVALWREGGHRKLRGREAAEALAKDLEATASGLPFRARGDACFFHAYRIGPGRYRLLAVDPGWLDPRGRRIELEAQWRASMQWTDAVTGETLSSASRALDLDVPAGGLRLLTAETVG